MQLESLKLTCVAIVSSVSSEVYATAPSSPVVPLSTRWNWTPLSASGILFSESQELVSEIGPTTAFPH